MNKEKSLLDVRDAIISHHGIPSFHFTMFGARIGESREKLHVLDEIITDSTVPGFCSQLTIFINFEVDKEMQETLPSMNESSIIDELQNKSNSEKLAQDPCRYRSSSFETKYSIKDQTLFGEQEIYNTDDEMVSNFMVFYNEMALKIQNDHRFKNWGLQARDGLIDTAWTRRKTLYIEIEVDKLTQNEVLSIKEKKSLTENLQKLDMASKSVDSAYQTFCKDLDAKGELYRNELENNFSAVFSRLKRKQTVVTLLIKHLQSKVKQKKESSCAEIEDVQIEETPEMLNGIVDEIYEERHDNVENDDIDKGSDILCSNSDNRNFTDVFDFS